MSIFFSLLFSFARKSISVYICFLFLSFLFVVNLQICHQIYIKILHYHLLCVRCLFYKRFSVNGKSSGILCFHLYLLIFVWFFFVEKKTHFEIMIHASIYLFAPFWIMYLDLHLQFLCHIHKHAHRHKHTPSHKYKVFHILFIYLFILQLSLFCSQLKFSSEKCLAFYYFVYSFHFVGVCFLFDTYN